jgi:hypothetical protein
VSTKSVELLENLEVLARQIVEIPKDGMTKRIARKFQTGIDELLAAAKASSHCTVGEDMLNGK